MPKSKPVGIRKQSKKEKTDLLELMQKIAEDNFVAFNSSIESQFFGTKPNKYVYVPRYVIRIPYPYLDYEYGEYGEERRGLFINWFEIKIGKRKLVNLAYKEQIKKWNSRPKTISFKRYGELE